MRWKFQNSVQIFMLINQSSYWQVLDSFILDFAGSFTVSLFVEWRGEVQKILSNVLAILG